METKLNLFSFINYKGCYLTEREIVVPFYEVENDTIRIGPSCNKHPIILNMSTFGDKIFETKIIEYMRAKEMRRAKNIVWNDFTCPYNIDSPIIRKFLRSDEIAKVLSYNFGKTLDYFVAFKNFLRKRFIESEKDGCEKYLADELFSSIRSVKADLQKDQKKFFNCFYNELYDFVNKADHNSSFNINREDKEFVRYASPKVRDWLENFFADLLVAIAIHLACYDTKGLNSHCQIQQHDIKKNYAKDDLGIDMVSLHNEAKRLIEYSTGIIVEICSNLTLFHKICHYIHSTELLDIRKRKIENFSRLGKKMKK